MKGLHYFDLLGGAVALLIAARLVAVAFGDGAGWDASTGLVAAAFLLSVAALLAFRSRAYSQKTPWLAGAFAATAMAAVFTFFSSLDVIVFAATLCVSSCALVVALVLRTKLVSEPVARHDVFKLGALAVGLLLGLACMELLLRLAPGILGPEMGQVVSADPSKLGIAHPYMGHLHRPNSTTILEGRDFRAVHRVDGNGFRNAWPWPQRAAIVVVGDSLAFGYGADAQEAWPAVVAKALPNEPLINLALVGASPEQYFRVFETYGVALRPKLLLVGVFARNDFWDSEMFDRWLSSGTGGNYLVWRDFGMPGPVRFSLADPIGTVRRAFDRYVSPGLRSSRVYNLGRALRGSATNAFSAASETIRFDDGHQIVLSRADFLAKHELGTKTGQPFRLAMDAFERIQAITEANRIHALMVLQPSKEETYLPLLHSDVPDATADLREAFAQKGIDYLDLAPAFRERAAAGERLFYEADGHPNPAGYALTARVVLAHLQTHADEYGLVSVAPGSTAAAARPAVGAH
jgi:lysophospholipase L1-like esterase